MNCVHIQHNFGINFIKTINIIVKRYAMSNKESTTLKDRIAIKFSVKLNVEHLSV